MKPQNKFCSAIVTMRVGALVIPCTVVKFLFFKVEHHITKQPLSMTESKISLDIILLTHAKRAKKIEQIVPDTGVLFTPTVVICFTEAALACPGRCGCHSSKFNRC